MPSKKEGSSRSTRSRPGVNRNTSGFSTRDFNVIDQSVNLMDMGGAEGSGSETAPSQRRASITDHAFGLTGLFRTSRETETLSRFSSGQEDYEFGDADAVMNPADTEEYIDGKRRRYFFLASLSLSCRNCRKSLNFRLVLTVVMAITALWLIGSSFRSFEKTEAELEQERLQEILDSKDETKNAIMENNQPAKKRYDEIKKRILDAAITAPDVFDNPDDNNNNNNNNNNGDGLIVAPQQSALDWLVFEDEADLPVDHEALLDRYGLAVLYFGTNPNSVTGDMTNSWKQSDHWLSKKGICLWHGIECTPREQKASDLNGYEPYTKTYDDNARVTGITLRSNHLKGSIPGELGTAFQELLTIDLEDNKLTGTLPVVLEGASKLRDLLLSKNGLVGTIPPGYVALQHLHQLGLSHNKLEGPLWHEQWSNGLDKLRYFAVSNNQLTGTIPDFTRLIRMTGLFLDGNLLEGSLPTTMASMTGLLDLRLSDNQFTGNIDPLQSLKDLESLHLANNKFTGEIPDMFDQLFRLHVLVLPNNKFEGPIPKTLTHLQVLRTLNLDSNELTGTLPGGLGLMTDAITISLKDNKFEGTIPTILGKLDDIKNLELNHNQLTGTIPSELGSCFRLESLHLQNNKLTGTIPVALGKLTGLSSMHLEDNNFKDTAMPAEVCALTEEDDLSILVSDCSEAIQCSCCTECL